MLTLSIYTVGPVQTNCYFIQDEQLNTLIIDPGEAGFQLIDIIQKENLKPIAILLTHGHFDHIGAVDTIRDEFEIPVYIHEIEKNTLTTPELNGSTRYPGLPLVKNREADHYFSEDCVMTIGPFTFEVRHTPGHSPGSVSFIFEQDGFAVVGDTLFNGSIGRTDLPGGDAATLLHAIKEKLLTLNPNITILPGHGTSTSPQQEMDSNPYLHGF